MSQYNWLKGSKAKLWTVPQVSVAKPWKVAQMWLSNIGYSILIKSIDIWVDLAIMEHDNWPIFENLAQNFRLRSSI